MNTALEYYICQKQKKRPLSQKKEDAKEKQNNKKLVFKESETIAILIEESLDFKEREHLRNAGGCKATESATENIPIL